MVEKASDDDVVSMESANMLSNRLKKEQWLVQRSADMMCDAGVVRMLVKARFILVLHVLWLIQLNCVLIWQYLWCSVVVNRRNWSCTSTLHQVTSTNHPNTHTYLCNPPVRRSETRLSTLCFHDICKLTPCTCF
jgi:hypothetical protein